MGINKSCKVGYQILTQKYKAKIEPGTYLYHQTREQHRDAQARTVSMQVESVSSVQIDLPPDTAEVFLEMIEEWHTNRKLFYRVSQTTPSEFDTEVQTHLERFFVNKMQNIKAAETLDKTLREQNPTLQKLWEKYETMKALVNEKHD
jgi:hypothetical protein